MNSYNHKDKNKEKKKILILAETYIPGVKGGGPVRSIHNLVSQLNDEYDFYIVTLDRDKGDQKKYEKVISNKWTKLGNVNVIYISPDQCNIINLAKLLKSFRYDLIYLNSFFSPVFTIIPLYLRKLGLIKKVPLVLAPRGEFSEGSLSIKGFKKQVYIKSFKVLKNHLGLTWQATSKFELEDIIKVMGQKNMPIIAPNLLEKNIHEEWLPRDKDTRNLKILFLSRVSKMKNLEGAIKYLINVQGNIQFNIYGPLEDQEYWDGCLKLIEELPSNITVTYKGPIENNKVNQVMKEHDIFLLPTLGENFGHVIAEAFLAGCPVVISDRTPWKNLSSKGVGWDIALEDEEMFQNIIQKCSDMEKSEYNELSNRAYLFGQDILNNDGSLLKNKELFDTAFDV